MSDAPVLAVCGGSGLYSLDGMQVEEERRIDTPFGQPSDAFILGTLNGARCVFLARHGRGHIYSPSEVNYRANIWALKSLGVRCLLSVSAVGSFREEIKPGHLVVVDQFFDRTVGRARSFFGDGCVAHVQFGHPVEESLRQIVLQAAREASGTTVHDGGTYVCIEGPTFSTRAESEFLRRMGGTVVGMTNLPEARLAREAEIAYATLALATDYDCWHEDEVSVTAVEQIVASNIQASKRVIAATIAKLAALGDVDWPSHHALCNGAAVMTARALIPEATKERLWPLIGRYLWPENAGDD